ncbi:hypothetical protein N9K75_01995 [bacterium]|nr:hypothetical protein [bacterium]
MKNSKEINKFNRTKRAKMTRRPNRTKMTRRPKRTKRTNRTNRTKMTRRGGNLFTSVPAPLVGKPWYWETDTWPGRGNLTTNHGNHYPQNMYIQDPMMRIVGGRGKGKGKGRGKGKKTRKGGASFMQNATNGYRDIAYNFNSAYSAFRGEPQPISPDPVRDQLIPRRLV